MFLTPSYKGFYDVKQRLTSSPRAVGVRNSLLNNETLHKFLIGPLKIKQPVNSRKQQLCWRYLSINDVMNVTIRSYFSFDWVFQAFKKSIIYKQNMETEIRRKKCRMWNGSFLNIFKLFKILVLFQGFLGHFSRFFGPFSRFFETKIVLKGMTLIWNERCMRDFQQFLQKW